ncbi:MAG: hypothetical protein HDT44_08870 [Ruminococcaceae bacterium]|nr:hypothetical protein [Oscillospiraceae bacterium]
MSTEQAELLKRANNLRDEIEKLEDHIEAGRQFEGEDMYEALIGMTEHILIQKQKEFSKIISQLEKEDSKRKED